MMSVSGEKRIGFVSTRLAGTDGVSLEARKWIEVLKHKGHSCFCFAGEIDMVEDNHSYIADEAHFTHPHITAIQKRLFETTVRDHELSTSVREVVERLKHHLHDFIALYNIDVFVVQNALAIPMNIPLGIAITEVIVETGIPTIAHHHDFYWERDRFLIHAAGDYIRAAFPPVLPSIHHVVINSIAREEFSMRTGQSCTTIPNVMDFDNPPSEIDEYATGLRESLGIAQDELIVLQPTRIVKRKRIEQAIDLVRRLGIKATLVITHAGAKDESEEYERWLKNYAEAIGVRVIFAAHIVQAIRTTNEADGRTYTLQDMYQNADFVTYPSGKEGFGNAFIESVYYKKPIVVNRYSTYRTDIEPKGFRAVEIDGFVTKETLEEKRAVITNHELQKEIVAHNYELGRHYFSYSVLAHKLQRIFDDIFGD